jgi:hypothetical protein
VRAFGTEGYPKSVNNTMLSSAVALMLLTRVQTPPQADIGGKPSTTVRALRLGNYLQLDVMISGKPAKFIVDSGAGLNVITTAAAKRLGIEGGTPIQAGGAGKDSRPAKLVSLPSVKIGDAEVRNDPAIIMDLPPVLACDGLVGYSFLRHFATTFDYDQNQLTFHDAKGFRAPVEAVQSELKIAMNHPHVKGTIAGESGWLLLDTGNGGSVSLYPWFIDKAGLTEKWNASEPRITGKGVGGFVTGRVALGDAFELAGLPAPAGPINLVTAAEGVFAGKENMANVGAEQLRRFVFTLDYPNKKAYFEKSKGYESPFRADGSGVRVDFENNKFSVIAVLKGSPADQAGLKLDDEVVAINGVKAGAGHPILFTRALAGPTGSKVSITYRRNREEKTVELTLENLLPKRN